MVKVLDSKYEGCEFKTHTGHGSFSKLRQFRLPYFASIYSAANEYKHCLEGNCDGPVQESQYNCTLSCFALQKPGLSTGHISLHGFLRCNAWGMTLPFFYLFLTEVFTCGTRTIGYVTFSLILGVANVY